jgi:hypothetical protein
MLVGFLGEPGAKSPRVKCWTQGKGLWTLQLRGYEQALAGL